MKKFLRISAVVATLMISYVAFSSHVSWGEWSCDKTPSGTGHCAPATLGSGTMCFVISPLVIYAMAQLGTIEKK